jgi:hypothetical protein
MEKATISAAAGIATYDVLQIRHVLADRVQRCAHLGQLVCFAGRRRFEGVRARRHQREQLVVAIWGAQFEFWEAEFGFQDRGELLEARFAGRVGLERVVGFFPEVRRGIVGLRVRAGAVVLGFGFGFGVRIGTAFRMGFGRGGVVVWLEWFERSRVLHLCR